MNDNEIKNELLNVSIKNTLKKMKILMIVGWPLVFVIIGLYVVLIASIIIGIQFIRKQKIAHGVCIMLFGFLTLGIWPFIAASMEIKKDSAIYDVSSADFKQSLLTYYDDVAKIILIIGIPLYIIGIFLGKLNLFLLGIGGLVIIIFGIMYVAVQDFRRDKLAHGVCIMSFGILTLGIWPLVYTIKQSKLLKIEILESGSQYI